VQNREELVALPWDALCPGNSVLAGGGVVSLLGFSRPVWHSLPLATAPSRDAVRKCRGGRRGAGGSLTRLARRGPLQWPPVPYPSLDGSTTHVQLGGHAFQQSSATLFYSPQIFGDGGIAGISSRHRRPGFFFSKARVIAAILAGGIFLLVDVWKD